MYIDVYILGRIGVALGLIGSLSLPKRRSTEYIVPNAGAKIAIRIDTALFCAIKKLKEQFGRSPPPTEKKAGGRAIRYNLLRSISTSIPNAGAL
jgi:hypothetical protein